ncbi:hypothetical protein GQR58_001793 [Nymphon striatum]|nr:hypothetical protein GQR58_001793 [Nymphon striatum]
MVDLLENSWTNPFGKDPSDQVNISTGTVASPEVATDMLSAHEKGEHAYKEFKQQRLQKRDCFHNPIKKMWLKTFSTMKSKPIKGTTKEIALNADRRLFGNMVLIAQSRKLEMHDVLSHPLGPLPWTLANGDGTMKKTNKAVLSKHLESKVLLVEEVPHTSAILIDAMGLMHKLHGENRTFSELSDHVFSQMLHAGHGSDRVHVIFDVYHSDSIKSAERIQRGSADRIAFSNIMPGHKIKNWRRLLSCTESKNKLTTFLAESWKEQKFREKLRNKCMLVTSGDRRGSRSTVRLVDITKLAITLGNDVCTALMGLHPWTGCDTVSAFAGQGKLKALKILLREQKSIDAFATLATSWNITNELFFIIEQFVCQLYCRNTKIINVNKLRYQMAWMDEKCRWMTGSPAPEVVLGLLSCKCFRSCRPSDYTCIVNGLKCTAACKLQTCSNMASDDEESEHD